MWISIVFPSSAIGTTAEPPASCMTRNARRLKLNTCRRMKPREPGAEASAYSVWKVACSGTISRSGGPAGSCAIRSAISDLIRCDLPLPERPAINLSFTAHAPLSVQLNFDPSIRAMLVCQLNRF
ncbi:hypothetical protein OMP38_21945 [Cohnella ginsengisoli]|uniref:Uncharacterized protein n=1 Tax=Cohnella ginsengisoli TaxID=425004 RepID=A0A9X4KJS2_9BACL|nr:hypothetical protein [Cohnella ginsengisoli]MDG0793210.1 hypothetical protein [Cohnella ginsengisoli]